MSPLGYLAAFDSGLPYAPHYVRYGSALQRPQIDVGMAARVLDALSVGVGLRVGFSMAVGGDLFLNSGTNSVSSIAFNGIMKPLLSPSLGLLYAFSFLPLKIGFSLKPPLSYASTMGFDSRLKIWQSSLPLKFQAQSNMFFDPGMVSLSAQALWASWRFLGQLDFEVWKTYTGASVNLESDPSGVQFSSSIEPSLMVRNIVVPRMGVEWNANPDVAFRMGIAYRPSIFSGLPVGVGNDLDPASLQWRTGMSKRWRHIFKTVWDSAVSFSVGIDFLKKAAVLKTAGSETNNPFDPKIGSPGYDTGGKIWTLAMNWSFFY